VFPSVVVGKDGWLFYTEYLSLRNYQKNDPLKNRDIKNLLVILERIDTEVRQYGGTFLVVIPPDKSTIYPQYMPDEIPLIGTETSMDRLVERVETYSDIQLLDLRPILMQARESSPVYYKTDTHWNCIGAFYAYEAIMSGLLDKYPNLQAYSLDDFKIAYSEGATLDFAAMMGVDIKESKMSVSPKFQTTFSGNSGETSPDLMIFNDSFYTACLDEFVEPTFSHVTSTAYKDIEMKQLLEMIKSEQPDIVVLEFVERFMDFVQNHFSE
jgi:hypothetical protein